MAIKIPSSKIYDNRHKLAKNEINSVDYSFNKVKKEIKYDEVVGSVDEDFIDKEIWESNKRTTKTNYEEFTYGDGYVTKYKTEGTVYDIKDYPVEIFVEQNNGKDKVQKLNNEKIESTFVAKKTTYDYIGSSWVLREEPQEVFVYRIPTGFGVGQYAIIEFDDLDTIKTSIPTYDGNSYKTSFSKLVAAEVVYTVDAPIDYENYETTIWKEVYEPTELTVSYYGNFISFPIETINGYIGDTNDSAYSLTTNNLFTDRTKIWNVPITEINANKLIKDFRNGKETYELLCSVKEYYNEDGTLAISTKGQVGGKTKMLFDIGDVVIPYKPTAAGDKPISYKKDGKTPKTFIVVGVTPIFDGAVWQRLNLVEKSSGYEFLFPEVEETVVTGCSGLILVNTDKTATYTLEGVKRVMYGDKLIEEVTYIDGGNSVFRIASFSYDSSTETGTLTLTTSSTVSNLDRLDTVTTPYAPAKEYEFFVLK